MNVAPTSDCDPPNFNPGQAADALPWNSCDSHVHVFGPHARYPLDPRRNYTPHECGVDDYRKTMAALGIHRVVLVQPSVYGTDNSALLDALRVLGPVARGIVVPAADVTESALMSMHELGVRGIRLNLINPQMVDFNAALRLCDRMAPLGWHLQVLLNLGRGGEEILQSVCDRTTAPVVVDHMGLLRPGGRSDVLLDLLGEGRCWVKLSAPYRLAEGWRTNRQLAKLVQELFFANPEQALWGSDWPHTEQHRGTPEPSDLSAALYEWLDPPGIAKACVTNPANLYQFPSNVQL